MYMYTHAMYAHVCTHTHYVRIYTHIRTHAHIYMHTALFPGTSLIKLTRNCSCIVINFELASIYLNGTTVVYM